MDSITSSPCSSTDVFLSFSGWWVIALLVFSFRIYADGFCILLSVSTWVGDSFHITLFFLIVSPIFHQLYDHILADVTRWLRWCLKAIPSFEEESCPCDIPGEKRFRNTQVLNHGLSAFFLCASSFLPLNPIVNPRPFLCTFPPKVSIPAITFCLYQSIYLSINHWHWAYYIYWLISTWIHLRK